MAWQTGSGRLDLESSQPTFPDSLTRPDLLYDAYYAEAVLLAYRILWDPRDAEDVAQECFLAVWRARQSYDRTKGSTRTWLLSIVRNRAIDLLRAQHRRPALRLEANFDTADKVDVAGEAAVHVDAEIARQALTDLRTSAAAGAGVGVF